VSVEILILVQYPLSEYNTIFLDTPVPTASTAFRMPLTPMSHVLNYELPIMAIIIYYQYHCTHVARNSESRIALGAV
jgi:hypothetical protein